MNIATTLIVALATLFSGCGKEPASAPTPNEDKTTIELRQTNATDNTVEVAVTLKNADIAYCLLLDAESQTPQLTAMTKGTKLTETATLTFDSLEAGYTYKGQTASSGASDTINGALVLKALGGTISTRALRLSRPQHLKRCYSRISRQATQAPCPMTLWRLASTTAPVIRLWRALAPLSQARRHTTSRR